MAILSTFVLCVFAFASFLCLQHLAICSAFTFLQSVGHCISVDSSEDDQKFNFSTQHVSLSVHETDASL